MDKIFVRVQLCEKVKLEPAFLSKDYKEEVLRRLKAKVEGICSKHGYIKPDSIDIYKICTGRVELIGLNGNSMFDVYFFADVCNPLLGSIIKCQVSNINKFGILAEAGNIIEAIIAKNSVSIQSDIDLEKVRIGDEVFIEVLGKKYELNDKKISLIARIVKSPDVQRNLASSSSKKQTVNDDDEEEQDQEQDVIEGGDNSDENELSDDESDDVSLDDDESEDESNEEDIDDEEETGEGIVDAEGDDKKDGNFFSDDDDYFKSGSEYASDAEDQSDVSDVSDDE
jgi:DNA-directed RNA polymerase subunit E'/Rpb7